MLLTKKQEEIVNCENKYISVVASAGSGKTRMVTQRILLRCHNLKQGHKILAITFSNKAADELKERLIKELGEDDTKEFVKVGTIHNLCNDILISYGHLINIPETTMICSEYSVKKTLLLNAIENIISIKKSFEQLDEKSKNTKLAHYLDQISMWKRDLLFPSDFDDNDIRHKLMTEYDEELARQNMIDFDDIIRYAYKLLSTYQNVLRTYRLIFSEIYVDEAQDINRAQYEIIKLIAGDNNSIFMVGDSNQAIYGFSGGSYKYLTESFPSDYQVKVFELNENFRSSELIIKAANKLEPTANAQAVYPIKGEFEINSYVDENEEAGFICDKILNLQQNGHQFIESFSFNNCCVIARNRYLLNPVKEILSKNNIAASIKSSPRGSFSSESVLMRLFELIMIVRANNSDTIHLNEINRIIGSGFSSYQDLKDNYIHSLKTLRKELYIDMFDIVFGIKEDEVDLKDTFSLLLAKYGENSNAFTSEEERLLFYEDLDYWKMNWKAFISDTTKTERNYLTFFRKMSLITTSNDDEQGVVLTTVHMSKGLEFDVVFIVGLNEGIFPDYLAVKDCEQVSFESIEEEKHSLFVAITRAKRLCYLSYCSRKKMPWGDVKTLKPSRFIKLIKE